MWRQVELVTCDAGKVKLVGVGGQELALTICGYQFPSGNDEYDRNWLVVEGAVCDGSRRWRFRDPCLLTNEASELAAWLASACNPAWPPSALTFLEPNLSFERRKLTEDRVEVCVGFDLEARPPWDDRDSESRYVLVLDCDRSQLLAAAEALRSELAPFPWRLGRST
jgi:hypothetical protein